MKPEPLNLLMLAGLLAWTGLLANRLRSAPPSRAGLWLLATLAVVVVLRLPYLSEVEPNPDTSTWLATALTVRHRPDPLLTLLTYADARPLTVLPLVLAQALGMPFGYAGAEVVGLLCWLGTLVGVYALLRLQHGPAVSLVGCWVLALFVGTTGFPDHVGYNSEHLAVLMLTLGTYGVLAVVKTNRVRPRDAALLGLLLGFLPFVKFQTVPMGLVLAGFLLGELARRRAWGAAGALVMGGLLPTVLAVGRLTMHGRFDVFLNTYLGHYFRYSFTDDYSGLDAAARFSPVRAVRFVFGNWQAVCYLAGQAVVLAAGLLAMRWTLPNHSFLLKNRILSLLLLATSGYAVLQAGNDFTHYTLLLFVPLLHATSSVLAGLRPRWQRAGAALVMLTALGQGLFNAYTRQPTRPSPTAAPDRALVALITAHSRPGESVVVWGYADRLHVLARRPMGYRFANTFYVHAAYRGFYDVNLAYFLADVRENRPTVFVDAMTAGLSLQGDERRQHDHFPAVAAWVQRHYRLVGTAHGARVYQRMGN